jgi:DeoR/GlpR family transcriptional regulator of sugar metabolism
MLAEQRRGLILSIVAETGAVTIADLHRRLRKSAFAGLAVIDRSSGG